MDTNTEKSRGGFPSTHWTQVYLASDHEQEAGARALADLLTAYRPALESYLSFRYRNVPLAELQDWTSSFIEKKILQQHLLRSAQESRGKFRTYVLTALFRFAEDQRRSNERGKRHPEGGLVRFDETKEIPADAVPHEGDLKWAQQVIWFAASKTESYYRSKRRTNAWNVFNEGCFLPMYHGEPRPSDSDLATKYGFDSAREVSNIIITAKRRFGSFLREIVTEYEKTDGSVDREIRDLIAIVSDGR